ncbi:MAG: GHKL domain-containing protein [candidate division Zixibacteria bacterium]|nr:GHKL domain-containing protein [candidate division Zixibacteria bacterium]
MTSNETLTDTQQLILSGRRSLDKQMLGLDALSKLARQFSNKPEFYQLIEVLLLTLSGQFSVADAFALLHKPGLKEAQHGFFGTGKYRNNPKMMNLELNDEQCRNMISRNEPKVVSGENVPDCCRSFFDFLEEVDAEIICPMVNNDKLLGVIGLGKRVTGKAFQPEDIDLFHTLVNTITPFVASSYHFWEIATLNSWYLSILNNVEQGVFVFDAANRLSQMNLTGFYLLKKFNNGLIHPIALRNKTIDEVFPKDCFGDWSSRFMRARVEKRLRFAESMVVSTENAESIYNVRVSTLTNDVHSGRDLIVTLDDVTEQRASEHRLYDLEKFAEKGIMASSISHELNNHLGLILGGAELAQVALAKGNTEKAISTLEKLKDSVKKIERFTAGLMNYGRIHTNMKAANLNDVITDVLSFVSIQKKFARIEITTMLDSRLPSINMDVDQMSQLLLNLLNNAADAILEAKRENGVISLETSSAGNEIVLSVSDNGVGVNPEIKEKLFKFRLTTKENGHGYGLKACAAIIDAHSGSVDIDSTLGNGTTFRFTFPIEHKHA